LQHDIQALTDDTIQRIDELLGKRIRDPAG